MPLVDTMPRIILLGGRPGSGQQTAARHLCDFFSFRRLSLSCPDPTLIDLNREKLETSRKDSSIPIWDMPRSEIKRSLDPCKPRDHSVSLQWTRAIRDHIQSVGGNWVITDLRCVCDKEVLEEAFDHVLSVRIVADKRLGSLSKWKVALVRAFPKLHRWFGEDYQIQHLAMRTDDHWDMMMPNNGKIESFRRSLHRFGNALQYLNYDLREIQPDDAAIQ